MSHDPTAKSAAPAARAVVLCVLAGLVASMLAGTSAAAAPRGWSEPPGLPVRPQTWVDSAGRQYVASVWPDASGDPAASVLMVTRDTPTGERDATWGTERGVPGLRALAVAPPAAGAVRDDVLALSNGGVLTTSWRQAGCAAEAVCARWFTRTTLAGAAVGGPVPLTRPLVPKTAMPDGSFTAVDGAGQFHWIGADGTNRGAPPGLGESATVDRRGRLVFFGGTGIRRWPAGGPIDVVVDTRDWCAWPALGPSTADDGFVASCGGVNALSYSLTVRRFDGTGRQLWSHEMPLDAPRYHYAEPAHVLGDAEGRVWVAIPMWDGYGGQTELALQPFDAAGAMEVEYRGPFDPNDWQYGITDLRVAGPDRLAFVRAQSCCARNDGSHVTYTIASDIVGRTARAPACTPSASKVINLDATRSEIRFTGCRTVPWRVPDRYVVTNTRSFQTQVAVGSSGVPLRAVVPVYPLTYEQFDITASNAAGSADDRKASLDLVAPFDSVEAFVRRQYQDLTGSIPAGEPAATAAAIRARPNFPVAYSFVNKVFASGLAPRYVDRVVRLYQLSLGRSPNVLELYVQVGAMRGGRTLKSIATPLVAGAEFKRKHGPMTSAARAKFLSLALYLEADKAYIGSHSLVTSYTSAAFLMLGRIPTATEVTSIKQFPRAWSQEAASAAIGNAGGPVFGLEEYSRRVRPTA